MTTVRKSRYAFTIVELLIVIVVIAILAAISLVAFNGVQKRALIAVLESDLGSASKQLKLFKAERGNFPVTVSTNCTASPTSDTNLCVKPSSGNIVETYTSPGPHTTFSLTITHTATDQSGTVTESSGPVVSAGTTGDGGEEGITIGSQTWAKTNVNVGTMVSGTLNQTNNSIIEKYCYNNDEASCDTYGGLYQWNEAMQYSTTPGARGVCPAGWRIPTDDDWKTLEMSLGMTQAQADSKNTRGTDQGTKLKLGGSSGLDIPLAGYRQIYDGSFTSRNLYTRVWSSSESGSDAWVRNLAHAATVVRYERDKMHGFSVRCLKN